jgi:hypothetical protein
VKPRKQKRRRPGNSASSYVSKADCESYLARAERHIDGCFRFSGEPNDVQLRRAMETVWRLICDELLDQLDDRTANRKGTKQNGKL